MGIIIRNIGNLNNLEGFLHREEIDINHFNIAYIGIGQAGGKIASDISRFGYYGVYINTCEQDLTDIEEVLKSIYDTNDDNYKIIRLKGYDGASKDRSTGLKAIKDNKELIQKELLTDKKLHDADFVWIVCSLGGGTGCGAVSTIAQIVNSFIRPDKRIRVKRDKGGNIINYGKSTTGIIAAIPDDNSSPKMKLNAAEALEELKVLQSKNIIGSVMLVDNEKLINDYLKKPNTNTDWTTYGNATVAATISELALLSGLPGTETFDKSEILDIWSTPGFLFIGKNRLSKDWQNSYIPDAIKKTEGDKIEAIVEDSFKKLGIFAEEYDFSYAVHGGMAIITKENKVINSKHRLLLHRALNKTLSTPELIHFGIFNNNIFGTFKEPKKDVEEAIIYTIAVINRLPKRIYDMTDNALKAKQLAMQRNNDESTKLKEYLKENELMELNDDSVVPASLDFDSILDGDIFESSDKDDFNKLFS